MDKNFNLYIKYNEKHKKYKKNNSYFQNKIEKYFADLPESIIKLFLNIIQMNCQKTINA